MRANWAPPAIEASGAVVSPNLWQPVRRRKHKDVIVRQSLDLAVSAEDNQAVESRTVKSRVEETLRSSPTHDFGIPGGSSAEAVGVGQDPRVKQESGSVDLVNPAVH